MLNRKKKILNGKNTRIKKRRIRFPFLKITLRHKDAHEHDNNDFSITISVFIIIVFWWWPLLLLLILNSGGRGK